MVMVEISICVERQCDRLCGLVLRVPGYRSRDPGTIPGATISSENQWVRNGVHSASWVQLRNYGRKRSGSGLEIWEFRRRDLWRWPRDNLSPQNLALTLALSLCYEINSKRENFCIQSLYDIYSIHLWLRLIPLFNLAQMTLIFLARKKHNWRKCNK
jgi:hypothetical protein